MKVRYSSGSVVRGSSRRRRQAPFDTCRQGLPGARPKAPAPADQGGGNCAQAWPDHSARQQGIKCRVRSVTGPVSPKQDTLGDWGGEMPVRHCWYSLGSISRDFVCILVVRRQSDVSAAGGSKVRKSNALIGIIRWNRTTRVQIVGRY